MSSHRGSFFAGFSDRKNKINKVKIKLIEKKIRPKSTAKGSSRSKGKPTKGTPLLKPSPCPSVSAPKGLIAPLPTPHRRLPMSPGSEGGRSSPKSQTSPAPSARSQPLAACSASVLHELPPPTHRLECTQSTSFNDCCSRIFPWPIVGVGVLQSQTRSPNARDLPRRIVR